MRKVGDLITVSGSYESLTRSARLHGSVGLTNRAQKPWQMRTEYVRSKERSHENMELYPQYPVKKQIDETLPAYYCAVPVPIQAVSCC